MKELEQHEQINPNEIKVETQAIKKLTHLGSFQHRPTHKIYELDLSTGEVTEAKLEVVVRMDGGKNSKIIARENCMYNQSLNRQNALRKFRNTLMQYKQHAGIK